MPESQLTLSLLQDTFSICRLHQDAPIPDWALGGSLYSITRTREELSVVCSHTQVPTGVRCDKGWRCLTVEGTLDLSLTGILTSLTTPLAHAEISVFVLSTYDTDYVMVKDRDITNYV